MLIVDGVKFKLHVPKDEAEFECSVKDHLPEIFGGDSLYFDIKPDLRSGAGIGSKPDGIAVRLDGRQVYVVEFELAGHPVHEHVVAQISKFNKAFKNAETRMKMAEAIYNEVSSDPYKKVFAESRVKGELFKYFTDLFSLKPKVVIIINEATEELMEAVEDLPFRSKIVEFKTFEREGVGLPVHAHMFEPIEEIEVKPIKEEKRPRTWEEKLNWTSEETRDLAETLIISVEKLKGVVHRPLGRHYAFYRGRPGSKSRFAVLMLGKKSISIRIRADPATFEDPQNWTGGKVYKGWFFQRGLGRERQFKINSKEQIEYAMKLIRQSYDIAETSDAA